MKRFLSLSLFLIVVAPAFPADGTLEMYAVDTEGGKALLLVSPSGQSMLIDGGFPGFDDRDALRVEEAAKAAGIKQLDFLVVTHYDLDHVGNVPAIAARLPVANFIDHGPSVAKNPRSAVTLKAYLDLAAKAKRTVVAQPFRKMRRGWRGGSRK